MISGALSWLLLVSWFTSLNGEIVVCNGATCNCPTNTDTVCVLNCAAEDSCKEQILNCADNAPCIIRCSSKASCSSGATINAGSATDVTIICAADDSCKDEIHIECGTGECRLECKTSTSCESWGIIDVTKAASFECIGNCPEEIPASFTAKEKEAAATALPETPGYYGQDCTTGNDDNPPDECTFGQSISSQNIDCSENFDCCLCKTIQCGTERGGGCEDFSCNGDQSCLGVRDIRLYGSKGGGVTMSCNGDQSCIGTKITGRNIKEIGCSGDEACARSTFEFDCVQDAPCAVGCGGSGSCAGSPKDSGLLSTNFTIGYTHGIECANEGCKYGTFILTSNTGGGAILCDGANACLEAYIEINNIEGIICGGVNACKNAHFVVINPMEDFSVECSAPHSCSGLTLDIIVNNGVSFFKEIGCGDDGCVGANVSIYNNGNQYINIEALNCEAPSACTDASFYLDGGIGFEECKCGEDILHSCDGISGIASCMPGLEYLKCSGSGACSDLEQKVINIVNGFELICSQQQSCKGFWLQIVLNNNAKAATNVIKGYKCDADESCHHAIIQVNNEQNDVSVEIEKIDCGGTDSCRYAVFILVGEVTINQIACSADSCGGCVIWNVDYNTVTACDSF